MRLYRVAVAAFAANAWSGEGAFRFGARWNSPGVRIVYASESLALAAVEFFVHLDASTISTPLLALEGTLPDALEIETAPALKPGWETAKAPTRAFGDAWVSSARTVALRVPSAAIPGEWNLLLNPAHPGFRRFQSGPTRPFRFDARMFRP